MALADSTELRDYCTDVARRAQQASVDLAQVPTAVKNRWLKASAAELRATVAEIVTENLKDVEAAPKFGLSDAQIDRLRLTPQTIESMAAALEQVASLDDPVGEPIETVVRPNGLKIEKIRVPLGVVFFIYESRPNVTADAAAICL